MRNKIQDLLLGLGLEATTLTVVTSDINATLESAGGDLKSFYLISTVSFLLTLTSTLVSELIKRGLKKKEDENLSSKLGIFSAFLTLLLKLLKFVYRGKK